MNKNNNLSMYNCNVMNLNTLYQKRRWMHLKTQTDTLHNTAMYKSIDLYVFDVLCNNDADIYM